MKNLLSVNILIIFTVFIVIGTVDFILLEDNFLQSSISCILDNSHRLDIKTHILLHGLLPIYIATIVFGASLLGVFLGKFLYNLFFRK